MTTPKTVIVLHPKPQVRILLQTALEARGFRVDPFRKPDLVLVDPAGGVEQLSSLARLWPDAETVRLPETLDPASLASLLGHVERLLGMRSTRALLAV